MTTYRYKAKDLHGQVIEGLLEADDLDELNNEMLRRGCILTHAKADVDHSIQLFNKISLKEFSIFTRQFSVILNSGLTLLNAVEVLAEQTKKKSFKKVLYSIHSSIKGGYMLSQVLEEHKQIFPEFFISMIRIGESSGTLDQVTIEMADYYERTYKIQKKLKKASTYPVIVIIVAIIIVTILLVKVVPMFADMLSSFGGGELPAITQFVMSFSQLVSNHILLIIVALAGTVGLSVYYYRTDKGRLMFDTFILKVPIIKTLVSKIITAKVARSMGALLKSGIPIIKAVDILINVIGNRYIEDKMKVSKRLIKEGRGMNHAFQVIDIFPPLLFHMIAVGEVTGELDSLLLRTAVFFDEEVEEQVEKAIAMIEPLLIIILGAITGVIILAVMLPMVQVMQSIN